MPSPCLNRCRLDAEGRSCLDCGRTLVEIAAWGSLPDEEQERVMALLPDRLQAMRRREAAAQQQQQQ